MRNRTLYRVIRIGLLVWIVGWLGIVAGGQLTVLPPHERGPGSVLRRRVRRISRGAPDHDRRHRGAGDPCRSGVARSSAAGCVPTGPCRNCWVVSPGRSGSGVRTFRRSGPKRLSGVKIRGPWPSSWCLRSWISSGPHGRPALRPFKTAITLRFDAPTAAVLWAGGLLILALFVERAFCRFLCPLGAGLAILGRIRVFSFLRRRPECGQSLSGLRARLSHRRHRSVRQDQHERMLLLLGLPGPCTTTRPVARRLFAQLKARAAAQASLCTGQYCRPEGRDSDRWPDGQRSGFAVSRGDGAA